MAKRKFIETFDVSGASSNTMVGTEPTGFSWSDTLSEPDEEIFAPESKAKEGASETGHRARFEEIIQRAVKKDA